MEKDFCNRYRAIGAGISCGSPTVGGEKASGCIIHRLKDLNYNFDYKFISTDNDKDVSVPSLIAKDNVASLVRRLYTEVSNCYDSGKIPFVIGGDHSLSIGSVASSLMRYGDDVMVVWIDAHTDINTATSSHSHFIHGMPNAVSMGLMDDGLSPIGCRRTLKPNNLAFLGARSIDDGEIKILNDNRIFYINVADLLARGIDDVVRELKLRSHAKYVHISFDVDGLDDRVFKATGYNIADGFSVQNVKEIITSLKKHFTLALFECVEYNPDLDKNKKDLDVVIDIILTALQTKE